MASSTVKTTESCDNKTASSPEDDGVDLEIKFEGTVLPSNDEISDGIKQEGASDEDDKDEKKDVVESKKDKGATRAKTKTPRRRGAKKSSAASSKANLDERAKDPSPVALLDMLAEVASATLKNDPSIIRTSPRKANKTSPGKAAAKIPLKRSSQSEVLNLDQIRMLSDKLLLNMFAELTADEIRRNYTYVCYLMPDKCQQEYTSFGNENRARLQMKTHLLGHIAELLSDANIAGRCPRGKFVAEPIPARKRRLATEHDTAKKRKFTKKVTNKSEKVKLGVKSATVGTIKPKNRSTNIRASGTAVGIGTGTADGDSEEYTKIREMKDGSSSTEVKLLCDSELKQAISATADSPKSESGNDDSQSLTVETDSKSVVAVTHLPGLRSTTVATTASEQPFHDHCYTTTQGGCYTTVEGGPLSLDFFNDCDEEDEDEEEEEVEYTVSEVGEGSEKHIIMEMGPLENFKSQPASEEADVCANQSDKTATVTVPKFYLERTSTALPVKNILPSPQKEAEAALKQLESVRLLQTKRSPRKQILTETKMTEDDDPIRELATDETGFESLDDDEDDTDFGSSGKIEKGSPEWERKLALKCIRLLRTKKKDERVALVCKICKDKMFTAQATLMYHYRSHAGIKPFVCNICNTTFTRQHSLNYHMLIHNNKSRFTCSDCGRKFRHPSHFKEHMRRHTGETPFECSDCGVRFKTRNTYKRHLKTRHGKLLTVNGIVTLSAEEFLKVKTNPKRRPRPRKDKETQWPEVSSIGFEVGKAVSLANRSQATIVLDQGVEATAADLTEEAEELEERSQQKVVVRSANEYSIAVTSAEGDAEPEAAAISISTDPVELGCSAEFTTAQLHSGENVALTFVECSRDGVSTLVALPIIKQESGNDDDETEWILPEMEVFPPSATASLHPILRCM